MIRTPLLHAILTASCLASIACGAPGRRNEAPVAPQIPELPPSPADDASVAALRTATARLRDAPADHAAGDAVRAAARQAAAEDRAAEVFLELLQSAPHTARGNLYFQLGMTYADLLQVVTPLKRAALVAKATEAFSSAIEQQPDLWEAWFGRALVYANMPESYGQTHRGIEELRRLADSQARWPQHEKFAQTYIELGHLLQRAGEHEAAHESWREGLRRFPGHAALQSTLENHHGTH